MIIDSPIISGSYAASGSLNQLGNVVITGSLTVTGPIIGAITGSADSASYAATATSASYAASASNAQNAATASYLSNYIPPFPYTGSAGISGSLTVNGPITAQTLIVQTITSSEDFVTGSTHFGSIIDNTHQFTGSVSISGSLAVNGSSAVLSNQTSSMSVATASYVANAQTASYVQTAQTASYVQTAQTASYWSGSIINAETASYVLNAVSASYAASASNTLNAQTASYWSGSITNAASASYALTASYSANVPETASYATSASNALVATSASYALTASYSANVPVTASYANNAATASYSLTSSFSLSGGGFPYSGSALITGSLLITNLEGTGARYLVTDASGNITAQTASALLINNQVFTASAGQTTFNITNGYTTGLIETFINGTKLTRGLEFTDTNGTSIVLVTGSMVNDIVEFVTYQPASGVTNNNLRQVTYFTASAGQTTFSVSYVPGLLDVFYNGSKLTNATDYTAANGTSIIFTTASAAGDIIEVDVYSYQVGAFSGIGGAGVASEISYFSTTNSITSSNAITINSGNAIVTGSLLGTASYADNAGTLDGLDSTVFTLTSSFNAQTASFTAFTASILSQTASFTAFTSSQTIANTTFTTTSSFNDQTASFTAFTASILSQTASINAFSASILSQTASINSFTSSAATRLGALESYTSSQDIRNTTYATTGSNTFVGTQYVSNTNNATGFSNTTSSIYTDGGLQVTKDAYFSSSMFIKGNLTVYGTQSVSFITSSQLNISTNLITVNTNTPSIRFGGLAVYDSGSTGATGSILWDSQNNHWIYTNPSGSSYSGGMFISGPRNTGSMGDEQGTTLNAIMKGMGGDHITSSAMFESGSNVGIGTSSPSTKLQVVGDGLFNSNTNTNLTINSNGGVAALTLTNGAGSQLIYGGVGGSNVMDFHTNSSFKVRIDSNGNMGIGTTSPSGGISGTEVALHLSNSNVSVLALESTAASGKKYQIYSSNDGGLFFRDATSSTQRMMISSGGSVGIGTTNPGQMLQVNGNAWINRPTNKIDNASCTEFGSRVEFNNAFTAGATGYAVFHYPTASVFRIYGDYDGNLGGLQPDIQLGSGYITVKSSGGNIGNVGIGTTSPSDKLQVVATTYNGITITTPDVATLKMRSSGGGTTNWGFATTNLAASDFGIYESNSAGGDPINAGTARLYFKTGGNVGIGTTNPTNHFEIKPGVASATLKVGGWVIMENVTTDQAMFGRNVSYDAGAGSGWRSINTGYSTAIRMMDDYGDGSIAFFTNGSTSAGTSLTNWDSAGPKMVIRNGGKVGIGITNPTGKLEVKGDGGTTEKTFRLTDSAGNETFAMQDGGTGYFRYGPVGIGTTSPPQLLTLYSANSTILRFQSAGATTDHWDAFSNLNARFYIWNVNTNNGAYLVYNSSGGWTSVSDARWKTDWTDLGPSLSLINQLKIGRYKMLNADKQPIENARWDYGVKAQELLDIIPDAVDIPEDENDKYGVIHNVVFYHAIKALQEANAKITALEEKLERNNII